MALGVLPGLKESEAVAVNERASIVGESFSEDKDGSIIRRSGFVWRAGKMTKLGGLGRQPSEVRVYAINNRDQVVETSDDRGFLWQKER